MGGEGQIGDGALSSSCSEAAGVTLIELLVVIVILAIVIGIAIPSFQLFISGNQTQAAATRLQGILQSARAYAIDNGIPVAVSVLAVGNACSVNGNTFGGYGAATTVSSLIISSQEFTQSYGSNVTCTVTNGNVCFSPIGALQIGGNCQPSMTISLQAQQAGVASYNVITSGAGVVTTCVQQPNGNCY